MALERKKEGAPIMSKNNNKTTDMQLDTKTMEGVDKHFSNVSRCRSGAPP
jgi:hypothetical protein